MDTTDVPTLSTTIWDSALGGRTQHIAPQTPRHDIPRVRDFLSQFAAHKFVLAELSVGPPPLIVTLQCVLIALVG